MDAEGGGAAGAVGRLGGAIAAQRAVAAELDPAGVSLAASLADDLDFLHGIPGYATAHARAAASGAEALDRIWPRSSPARPEGPEAAARRCGELAAILEDPIAATARSLSALPPGEDALRLRAEARQVLLLDKRLAEAGIDPLRPGDTETGRAALALDALYRDHRLLSPPAAEEALGAARSLCELLLPLASAMRRLADLAGLSEATAAQVAMLARCLAEAPAPWPAGLAPGEPGREAREDLAAAVARHVETRDEAAALDAAHGPAWRSEEPGKLETAARLLAMPGDPRRERAAAYAASLECRGPDAGPVLSRMARARVGQRRPWPPACMEPLADDLPAGLRGDPLGAHAHLDRVAAWTASVARSETLTRLHGALCGIDQSEREALVAAAAPLVRALAALPAERLRAPAGPLAEAVAAEVVSLEGHCAALSAFGPDALEAARRPGGHLRERRAALSRLGREGLFAALGLGEAEDVPLAMTWIERARTVLPDGVDPCGKRVAVLSESARAAESDYADLLRIEGIARDRVGEADPHRLVAAARAALADLRLREAREAVAETNGWGLIAWLEEEGIEPDLWAEALAAREAEPPALPEPGPGIPPPPPPVTPEARAWSEPRGLVWRRLRVVPAQATRTASLDAFLERA